MPTLRRYECQDETLWTRCRTLAFLDTSYFDDVLKAKPVYEEASLEFVTVDGAEVVGLIDVTFGESTATIETIAVHPERHGNGLATALLGEVLEHLPETIGSVDAWTRDDVAANTWYQRRGFVESYRYLHVYANETELEHAGLNASHGLTAVACYFHAGIESEAHMRGLFNRVHICRQYILNRELLGPWRLEQEPMR